MLLPGDKAERERIYRNVVRACDISRNTRRGFHERLRQIALTGSDTNAPARYNKIAEFIGESAADLYTPECQFGVVYPPHYGDRWIEEQEAARDELQRLWSDTDAALIFGAGVAWAHTYPTVVYKVIEDRGEPKVELIADTSVIGVLREGVADWDRQEAICHWYELDLAGFRRLIAAIPDPAERTALMEQAEDYKAPSEHAGTRALGPAMSRIILATASPTMQGTVNMTTGDPARPQETENVVRMVEAWVWDDEMIPLCDRCRRPQEDYVHTVLKQHDFEPGGGWDGDYRVVQMIAPSEQMLWDPQNFLIPGEHCFHALTLEYTPDYLWGVSKVDRLYPLQAWREKRMNGVDMLLEKQVDPPIIGIGVAGTFEERLLRLRRPGGSVALPQSGSTDVKPFLVPMPPEAFAEIEKIDEMFARASGRRSRERQPGIRSGDQVMAEALLAGGPSHSMAMRVEACAGSVATAMLRLQRRLSKTTLRKSGGEEFLLSQMPGDFVAKVTAHSASPLYQESNMAKIQLAVQAKALEPDELITLLRLPMPEILVPKARKRAVAQAETAKKAIDLKEREIHAKELKAIK